MPFVKEIQAIDPAIVITSIGVPANPQTGSGNDPDSGSRFYAGRFDGSIR